MKEKKRCPWVPADDALYADYHDHEWGRPVRDDRTHFEYLILEGAQAGLSWLTVLRKRENYRRLYAGFDASKVSKFTPAKQKKLLADPGIIRNRLKIAASITNARAFLAIQKEFGSFDKYVWRFVGGKPIVNRPRTRADYRARSPESDALSADLKKRGFRFVGSTIIYAHMQATGLVDDHAADCFRARRGKTKKRKG